jgi:hypothetical protein
LSRLFRPDAGDAGRRTTPAACVLGDHAHLADKAAFKAHLAPLHRKWFIDKRPPRPRRVRHFCPATRIGSISNSRLIAADATGVTFRYKDYRIKGPGRYKTMTPPDEFESGDVAIPTPGHRRRSPASGSHRTWRADLLHHAFGSWFTALRAPAALGRSLRTQTCPFSQHEHQQALALPLPAASNTVVINARCSLRIEADQRVIVVGGLPHHYRVEDAVAEAYAMVLVRPPARPWSSCFWP